MSTKQQLIREFAECGITCQLARELTDSLLNELKTKIKNGEEVQVKNFGKFETRVHSGRKMVNPKTGEEHQIEPRFVPHFTPAKKFREEISEHFE